MARYKEILKGKAGGARFMTPLRVVLMTALIFYLAFLAYRVFGVSDTWGWIEDVLLLLGVFILVILAAAGVVWLMVLVRKRRG